MKAKPEFCSGDVKFYPQNRQTGIRLAQTNMEETNLDYPNEWETEFTAKNGKKTVFRPEPLSDTEMLWKMFSTSSKENASNLLPPFTRERIEGWTRDIDYNEVLAIVAFVDEENEQRIIGSTSLRFNPQEALTHKAELGLTVHDDYQNMGIGQRCYIIYFMLLA